MLIWMLIQLCVLLSTRTRRWAQPAHGAWPEGGGEGLPAGAHQTGWRRNAHRGVYRQIQTGQSARDRWKTAETVFCVDCFNRTDWLYLLLPKLHASGKAVSRQCLLFIVFCFENWLSSHTRGPKMCYPHLSHSMELTLLKVTMLKSRD